MDGTKTVITSDGVQTVTMPDGTVLKVKPNNTETITVESGNQVDFETNGTTAVRETNCTTTVMFANGTEQVADTDNNRLEVGSDGTKELTINGGPTVAIDTNGDQWETISAGSPDVVGNRTVIRTATVKGQDGTKTVCAILDNGTTLAYLENGTVTEYSKGALDKTVYGKDGSIISSTRSGADFASFSVSASVPGVISFSAGFSVNLTNGDVFTDKGVAVGNESTKFGFGGSVMAGKIIDSNGNKVDATTINTFLDGDSTFKGGGYWVGGNYIEASGMTAIALGLTTHGVGVGTSTGTKSITRDEVIRDFKDAVDTVGNAVTDGKNIITQGVTLANQVVTFDTDYVETNGYDWNGDNGR